MAAKVDIFNLALTFLGAKNISSVSDGSKNAQALLQVYDMIRKSELRKLPNWNFAIKMAQLPASGSTPMFDRAYSYPLPADFINLVAPFPESNFNDRDWIIQNGQIYSNYASPLNIRYVADITDENEMDPIFICALAAQLSLATADQLTQSAARIQAAEQRYEKFMSEARKANAFDNVSVQLPMDPYWTVRL